MDDYLSEVKSGVEFQDDRELWLQEMRSDSELKAQVLETMRLLEARRYVYQWNWLGIPIIKFPEEILLIQELFYKYRPSAVIEIGVARGGGIALYHSLQSLLAIKPHVLGIDIKFFPHTKNALNHLLGDGVHLLETSSTSREAVSRIRDFISGHERVMVILDGDHSHDNVLKELEMCDSLLPQGSIVLCADTIISHVSQSTAKRNWNQVANPRSALKEFLRKSESWNEMPEICDKVVLSESPNGWIMKVK
jgi:cephalosporin hydroxylase